MGILAKLGFIFIILVMGAILLYVYDKSLFYSIITPSAGLYGNKTVSKAQITFVSNEVNAIESSSPIPINPANILVFGSWKNTKQKICGQEQAYFETLNPSQLNVLYTGFYVPIYLNVKALGNSAPNLIGQKVYLDFIANNNENISAPYIVKTEVIKNNEEFWNFTFDGNTNNAINSMLNLTTANITTAQLNGVVLLNGTTLISPVNPDIDNGNFITPYCQ